MLKIFLYFLASIFLFAAAALGFAWWYDHEGQSEDKSFNAHVAQPAFTASHPVVRFDEAHDNFHTAEGRYRPLAQLLRSDGFAVEPNRQKFSAQTLKEVSILVVANALGPAPHEAAPAFSPAEEQALAQWVDSGGSLLLIADHAPFGAAAQRLAAQFKIRMYLRFARDDANHEGWDNEKLLFSRANGLLPVNPISQGRNSGERVRKVVTFTGQSLSGPASCLRLLPLGNAAYDWESRSVRYSARGHSQALACPFGRGRIVVLGEAAMLSAQVDVLGFKFGMNRAGNDDRQFALNVFHWLARLI
jgi:hypothetical protein